MGQSGKHRADDELIMALLSCSSIAKAAKQARISRRTVLRRLKESEFRKAYMEAKAEVLRTATGILTRNSGKAAETLAKIFCSKPKQHQGPQVSAAVGTIRLALDSFALENLECRIAALEHQSDAI
jgi:hypothetical protein